MTHFTRFSARVRARNLAKLRAEFVENQKGRCIYCLEPFSAERPATFEHIVPRSKGGRDTRINGCASCEPCNQERGTANHGAFLRYKRRRREARLCAE